MEAQLRAAGPGVAGSGSVVFLFGAFCAPWARNTDRNPWLRFVLGLFFSVVTVVVLLAKNAVDRGRAAPPRFDLDDHRVQ